MRILRSLDYKIVPWKNGGGVTREIASAPVSAAAGPFLWRFSLATIRRSGPFSLFPGIDRTIATLRGDEVRLLIDGREAVRLEALGEPFGFSGDDAVEAYSNGAETIDLNIMTLRGRARHQMTRHGWTGQTTIETQSRLSMLLLNRATMVSSGQQEFQADMDDVIIDIPSESTLSLSSSKSAVAYLIGIDYD